MSKKETALGIAKDIAGDYAYYDRKNCEQLSVEDLDNLIESGELTFDEIAKSFISGLKDGYGLIKEETK